MYTPNGLKHQQTSPKKEKTSEREIYKKETKKE